MLQRFSDRSKEAEGSFGGKKPPPSRTIEIVPAVRKLGGVRHGADTGGDIRRAALVLTAANSMQQISPREPALTITITATRLALLLIVRRPNPTSEAEMTTQLQTKQFEEGLSRRGLV